jgi:TatD DNase family protein
MALAPLVDVHVHLQDERFAPDLPAVLGRARQCGVRHFVCNGTSPADWPGVADLARREPGVIPCFGLHPWLVSRRDAGWLAELEAALVSMPSAVGEVGLDHAVEPRNDAEQAACLKAQLELASRLDRPVMVHCVRAWGAMLELLRRHPTPGVLLHAYGGSADMVAPLAAAGAYFSFAASVLAPHRHKARAALAAVPIDRLLLETDAPDLPPPAELCVAGVVKADGTPRNEPANLPCVLEGVAKLLGMDQQALAERLLANSRSLLGGLLDVDADNG